MAPARSKNNDPRPPPTPPPGGMASEPSLEAQEAQLLAQLDKVRMAKEASRSGNASDSPAATRSPATTPSNNNDNTPSSLMNLSSEAPPTAHHSSTAPARNKPPIPKVKRKIKKLAAYLKEAVQMDKSMYNFFLRVVRAACGIVKPGETWSDLSHEKRNIITRAITEDKDNRPLLPYIRHRFENDWVIETAIIRHLQERKCGKKRAAEDLNSDDDESEEPSSKTGSNPIHASSPSPPPSVPPTSKTSAPGTVGRATGSSASGSNSTSDSTMEPCSDPPVDPDLPDPFVDPFPNSPPSAMPQAGVEPASSSSGPAASQPATKQALRITDSTNIASRSAGAAENSSLPNISGQAASKGKRKAPAVDATTNENEVDSERPPSPSAPPPKKPRTRKAAPTAPTRTNPKRAPKAK